MGMQLDEQMVEFKVQTDDIWTQMLGLGAATPSTRQRRQGKDQYGAYEAQGVNAGPVCGKSLPSSPLTWYRGFLVTVVNSSFG
ncbi:hypothetical protein ANCCAN_26750 [Ancylostoma caninum]|uniref:Uncharacterized protein n=1 Tax=Ancylostoma caninum TaxID=29170 RepID=A0A368F9H8_ANCCA|nr:hypothetical protein ANCCAN_26750 [Ancylostoma caninum]